MQIYPKRGNWTISDLFCIIDIKSMKMLGVKITREIRMSYQENVYVKLHVGAIFKDRFIEFFWDPDNSPIVDALASIIWRLIKDRLWSCTYVVVKPSARAEGALMKVPRWSGSPNSATR